MTLQDHKLNRCLDATASVLACAIRAGGVQSDVSKGRQAVLPQTMLAECGLYGRRALDP